MQHKLLCGDRCITHARGDVLELKQQFHEHAPLGLQGDTFSMVHAANLLTRLLTLFMTVNTLALPVCLFLFSSFGCPILLGQKMHLAI